MPASASELLLSDLSEKTKLLQIAREEARRYKIKCEALASKIKSSKKRPREPVRASNPASVAVEEDAAPAKKPSPNNKTRLIPYDLTSGSESSSDDDEVPPPAGPTEKPVATAKPKLFLQLNSLLCAYKDGKVKPGSAELPFDICAELCKEEAQAVSLWDSATRKRFHPHIISALRVVYPNKVDSWFKSAFLTSPTGATKYWTKVLTRRAEIWEAAARKAAANKQISQIKSLKDKIRAKIEQRRNSRLGFMSAPVPRNSQSDPFRTPERHITLGLSSDSDDSTRAVIDLSASPPTKSVSSSGKTSTESPPKMAPAPK